MKAFAACVVAGLFAALPAAAQEKTVNGLVINLGIMSAEKAVHAEGHSEAHPHTFPSGSQHILVTLADAKTHRRISDADVVVELRSPKGGVVERPLLHTQSAGLADYSELFVFGAAGTYSLRVKVRPMGTDKPTEAVFTIHHEI